MILFDYGNTLIVEPEWNLLKGLEALWPFVTQNPTGITPEELVPYMRESAEKSWECTRKGFEIPEHCIMQSAFAPFGLEFNLSDTEMEEIYFENAIPPIPVPGVSALLSYCRENNIRTAVVSNLSFDGSVLEKRLKKVFPDHTFEFVLSSANYFLRKPHLAMHRIALAKSKLNPSDIWFIGDNFAADIETSRTMGMTPIWLLAPVQSFYKVALPEEIPFEVNKFASTNEIQRFIEPLSE